MEILSQITVEGVVEAIGSLIVLCGAISAFTPDTKLGRAAKFINAVGLNIGKAANDKEKNK